MSQRNFLRNLSMLALGGALFAAVGCAKSTAGDETAGEAAEAVVQGDAPEGARDQARPHRDAPGERGARPGRPEGRPGMGPGGLPMMLHGALKDLGLSADQQATIDKAFEALRADAKAARPGEDHEHVLADQVRAGKIDRAALDAAAADKGKGKREAMASAIGVLHDTLTPAQRLSLVASLKEKMAEHGMCAAGDDERERPARDKGDRPERGPKGAHGEGGKMKSPVARMLHGLDLSAEQQASIDKALAAVEPAAERPDREAECAARQAQFDALAQAFVASDFDAAAALPAEAAGPMRDHLERFTKTLEAVVPILTVEQRAELADRLEHMGPMGKGAGPKGAGHEGPRGAHKRPGRGAAQAD